MSSLKQKLMRLREAIAQVGESAPEPPVRASHEPRVERDDHVFAPTASAYDSCIRDVSARPFAPTPARWPRRALQPMPAEGAEFDAETGEFVLPPAPPASWALSAPAGVSRVAPDADDTFPGERTNTAHGPLRAYLERFDACHRHGGVAPALALAACARDVALLALDPAFGELDLSRALYLDTETTGLLGGTGTLPFLMGTAWFEGDVLHVEQLFLERPGEEGAMLQRLRERIANASVLVSFNGKSFDWPLLRTRFVLARMQPPALPPHLDLLHLARRVYKRRLGSVRLVALERALLGFERVDDIDGALIPELYLGYLRGRVNKRALVPILDHNRSDLVALPALLGEVVRRFRCALTPTDARDALGFASVSARAHALGFEHAYGQALGFVTRSAAGDVRGEFAPEAHFLAGELQRKSGDLDAAVGSYRAAIDCAHPPDSGAAARAHLALAKLYEHKLRSLDHALCHAERAAHAQVEDSASAHKRLARLREKLRRGEAQR